MPTNKSSARSTKKPTRTMRGRRLERAAREALAHARSRITLPEYVVSIPESVNVAAVREKLGLSRAKFAATFGLDVAAVRDWEQARRRPDRTARALLAVIAEEPDAVRRALAGFRQLPS